MNTTQLFGGAYIVHLRKFSDARGFFSNILCYKELPDTPKIDQVNLSFSKHRGTLRGMHYQISPNTQVKMIRCHKGHAYDVIVDMNPQSPTYLKWESIEMTQDSGDLLVIPNYFAQGFFTMEPDTEILYMNNGFYDHDSERGVRWNDPKLNIIWPYDPLFISEKDKSWGLL